MAVLLFSKYSYFSYYVVSMFHWSTCCLLKRKTYHLKYNLTVAKLIIFMSYSQSENNIFTCIVKYGSRDSAVGIAAGYGLDGRMVGVRVPAGTGIVFSPRRSDQFWGPPSPLSNGYRGLSGRVMKLTTHLQPVPRSRIPESIHPVPIRLHDIVFN
jgi:hypothetical protein